MSYTTIQKGETITVNWGEEGIHQHKVLDVSHHLDASCRYNPLKWSMLYLDNAGANNRGAWYPAHELTIISPLELPTDKTEHRKGRR